MSLTHVSLFSGIGGFIRQHYPDTHLFTDVREVTGHALQSLGADPARTILTAGWPCQGNSVAGRRGGMGDERSGLWSEVARILAEHRPAWFIGENVPGLLSVAGGWDYATVIGDMARLGYGFAWRVLDAQHFGVPQRRRRIVIVGHLGDTGRAPAQVLLEPESSSRNPAQSITPRPIFARRPGSSARGGRVAQTLTTREGKGPDSAATTTLIVSATGTITHALTAEGADASEDGTGRGAPIVTYVADVTPPLLAGGNETGGSRPPGTLVETAESLIAYQKVQRSGARDADGELPPEVWAERGIAATLSPNDLTSEHRTVELVTNTSPTSALVDSLWTVSGYDREHGTTQEARPREVLRALREAVGEEAAAEWLTGVAASLLPAQVLRPSMHGEGVRREAGDPGADVDDSPLALPEDGSGRSMRGLREAGRRRRPPQGWRLDKQLAGELDQALSGLPHQGAPIRQAVRDLWRAAQGAGLLREALPAVQEDRRSDRRPDADPQDMHGLRGAGALAVALRQALHASQAEGHAAPDLTGGMGVTVRRLTPRIRECERLQGYPDGHTLTSNGKPQSDSARYKQLGNSIAVPVFEWVTRRLVAVDQAIAEQAAA